MSTLSVTSVNSLIDNAFVDDSADISSDETLFSISPGFGGNDSDNLTPLPTISTPLNDLKNSFNDTFEAKSSTDELTIDSNYQTLVKVKKVEKTASKQKSEKAEPKDSKQTVAAQIVAKDKSEKKDDLSVKSIDKSSSDKSKSLSVAVSTIAQELKKLEALEREKKKLSDSKEPKPCGCGQTRIQFSDTKESKVCTNKIEQSNKSIDMKSQMTKYNDYLHYLRFGFPRKAA